MIITFCQRIINGKKIFGPIIRVLLIQSREIPLQLVIWEYVTCYCCLGKVASTTIGYTTNPGSKYLTTKTHPVMSFHRIGNGTFYSLGSFPEQW